MKRSNLKYIWLILLGMIMSIGFAQEENEYQFYDYKSLGVKLGANYFVVDLQPAIGSISPEISYTGGLVYTFSNKKYVGFQLELLYSQRKWKETFQDAFMYTEIMNGDTTTIFEDGTAITDLKFIEVPFMTNINLGSGRLKYIINIGSYFAFRIDKTLKINLPLENVHYNSIINRLERKSDFGLLIGGALRYISSVGIFQLDARFAYGYQKLYNEDATGFKYSNMSGLSIGFIYSLNLQK